MANRNAKDVKRFVDNISKEVSEKAYDPTEYATKEYVDETFEKKADVVDVVANPTLEGTEPDLTGLEVNGIKYKVPQGGGIEYVELSTSSGTLNYEQIQKLTSGNYIKYNNTVLIPNGYEQQGEGLGGSRTYYFASTISNDVYLSMSFTLSLPIPPDATATYTVTEVQVGGGDAKYLHSISAQLRLGTTDIYFFGKYLSTSSTAQTSALSALSAIVGEKRCSGYAASVADGTWAELNGLYISNGTTKQIIGASYDVDNGFNILLFADGTAENTYGATSVNCEDDVQ